MDADKAAEVLPLMGRDWLKVEYSERVRRARAQGEQPGALVEFVRRLLNI
jgi:hypothetical protein